MTDYKKLYHLLFNAITDGLEALGRGGHARRYPSAGGCPDQSGGLHFRGCVKRGAPAGAP